MSPSVAPEGYETLNKGTAAQDPEGREEKKKQRLLPLLLLGFGVRRLRPYATSNGLVRWLPPVTDLSCSTHEDLCQRIGVLPAPVGGLAE